MCDLAAVSSESIGHAASSRPYLLYTLTFAFCMKILGAVNACLEYTYELMTWFYDAT